MSALISKTNERIYYILLDDSTIFLWARAPQSGGDLSVLVNNDIKVVDSAYFSVGDALFAYALLSGNAIKCKQEVELSLSTPDELFSSFRGNFLSNLDQRERLLHIFGIMSTIDHERFLTILVNLVAKFNQLNKSDIFRSFCANLREKITSAPFHITGSFWLNKNALYFEGNSDQNRPFGEPMIFFTSDDAVGYSVSRFVQLSEKHFAFIAVFKDEDAYNHAQQGSFAYITNGKPVPIQGISNHLTAGLDFFQYLSSKSAHHKQNIRNIICQSLIDFTSKQNIIPIREFLQKLQLYVDSPAIYCNNASDPFNIHFETIIPLGCDGVFICGWMRDPYNLLESIDVHSALGFSFPLGDALFKIKRPDVQAAFASSIHGGFDEDMGFVAFAPLPEHYAKMLKGIAELHAVSFTINLKGGIKYEVQPELHFKDARASRDIVLKIVPKEQVTETMLTRCIGPAALSLHKKCMEEVAIKEIYVMGKQVENPKVSLSIPLYKRLDFLKVQFATMANDPSMKEVEVIYVLDSPWQEDEVRDFLREYAHLYQLPVKLIVMKHNSGYAAASNTGANYARGEYIVLLNSDVFPRTKNWTHLMADFYASQDNIGALAPKLIYEDESLQHAGMFFTKTTFPDWINLHYYKGYANNYAPANENRIVPAVTGACLMMSSKLWKELGGLSVDYVVGDFEDSDLCLKCVNKGLNNWYFADAELFHLERQSVPLNNSYADSLAWRYNARQHTQRWNEVIVKLMDSTNATKPKEEIFNKKEATS